MVHISPPPTRRREPTAPPERLLRLLRRICRRLFDVHDVQAQLMGLEVTESPAGLRRRYRDPRFDLLAGCPVHRGPDGTACGFCGARFFREWR
ncbi:hypothetical protein ACIBF1_14160 [Spirillospora sp. NPDC050679]